MKYILTVLSVLTLGLAFGQGYESIEHLFSKADEILVVKVLNEKTASESYMTCKSYVTAEITQQLKITRLNADTRKIQFVRILGCTEGNIFPPDRILDKEKRFIVFLSSANPGYDSISNMNEYALSDYILGLQAYTEDIFRYLQIKQREKR